MVNLGEKNFGLEFMNIRLSCYEFKSAIVSFFKCRPRFHTKDTSAQRNKRKWYGNCLLTLIFL